MPDNLYYYAKLTGILVVVLIVVKAVYSLFLSIKVSETLEKSFLSTFFNQFFRKSILQSKAKKLLKNNNFIEAGKIFEEIGEFTQAITCYEQGQNWYDLAKLYEGMGMKRKAALFYEKGDFLRDAVRVYKEIGAMAEAAKILEKNQEFEEAADLYFEVGDYDSAIKIFQNFGYYNYIGKAYEKLGKFKEAAEAYLKWYKHMNETRFTSVEINEEVLKYLQKAADLFIKAGDINRAIEILEEEGIYGKAARICEENGMLEKAAELYELNHDFKAAADIYMKANNELKANLMYADYYYEKGENLLAANYYYKAGDYGRAAELYEWEREYKKAAEAFKKNENYTSAAENYLRIGEKKEAARLFSLGGEHNKAGTFYREIGELSKAGEEFLLAKNFFSAGLAFYDAGDAKKAIEAFQKVNPSDPNYGTAILYITKIFLASGKYDLVISTLEKFLGEKNITPDTIDHFYTLAKAYQSSGLYEKAIEIYKLIQVVNFDYKDTKTLLEEAYKSLSEKKELEIMSASKRGEGRYRIIDKIGEGGMGIVYKAEDNLLKRIVALKVLKKSIFRNEKSIDRFYSEARLSAKMNHPNIITVYDVGTIDGEPFISMEFVEGTNFINYLKRKKRLSFKQTLFVALNLFRALEYAHKKGIIHRDIKPQNIMLTRDKQIKIMDFGLAVFIKEKGNDENVIAGTPTYMSPEQIKGENVDNKTDIYSAGITLFHLIVGFPPFRGDNVANQHLFATPPKVIEIREDVPVEFSDFIAKCIEKSKDKRYLSASEALLVLKKIQSKYRGK